MRRFGPLAIDGVAVARAVPDVPFIEGEPELFWGALVAADEIANGDGFGDLAVHREIHGQEFRAVATGCLAVVKIAMQGEAVDVVVALLEDFTIPLEIGGHERAAGAAGDELE